MTSHTPEPWVIAAGGAGETIVVSSVRDEHGLEADVCEVYGGNEDKPEVRGANARLIAAAPDLLEALKHLAGLFNGLHANAREWGDYQAALAAVAKAGGYL